MPWDFHHKEAVKEENKERLAQYITGTMKTMDQLNHDIQYYKTCQNLDKGTNRKKLLEKVFRVRRPRD